MDQSALDAKRTEVYERVTRSKYVTQKAEVEALKPAEEAVNDPRAALRVEFANLSFLWQRLLQMCTKQVQERFDEMIKRNRIKLPAEVLVRHAEKYSSRAVSDDLPCCAGDSCVPTTALLLAIQSNGT